MASVAEQINLPGVWKDAKDNVQDELGDLMVEAQTEMLRVIDVRDAKATGDLRDSIEWYIRETGGGIRGVVGADAKPGSNLAPYAHFVDQPTRAHWPPITPLERWARAKFKLTGEEKTRMAWIAARSIAKKGTPGVRFTDAGWREIRGDVTDRIEAAIERAF